jgi:tripartite-type tricarboxylate transporter receptor subunit TctC
LFRHVPRISACFISLLLACSALEAADKYPSRPIRLVLGVGTGGVGDVSMRLAAQQMSKSLGQTIVVDNRPSAGGVAAALAVVKANPDGYTILQTGNAAAISASLFKKLPYDVQKDFVQISTVAIFQLALVATPHSGLGTPADVVAFARKNPGKLNIGTINVGSTQFLAAELFKSMAGIEAQVVPFKSNTLLIAALRGNELPVSFELLGPVLTHIKAGTLRALAVGSERRFASLPDIPTVAESGVPGFNVASWTGMSVPAGTPRAIVERLSREAVAAADAPEVRQPLLEMGIEARGSTPDETRKRMSTEIAKWRAVIDRAGIERQ